MTPARVLKLNLNKLSQDDLDYLHKLRQLAQRQMIQNSKPKIDMDPIRIKILFARRENGNDE